MESESQMKIVDEEVHDIFDELVEEFDEAGQRTKDRSWCTWLKELFKTWLWPFRAYTSDGGSNMRVGASTDDALARLRDYGRRLLSAAD